MIVLLILFFIFLLMTILTYARLLMVVKFDAGLVPLSPEAIQQRAGRSNPRPDCVDAFRYRPSGARSRGGPASQAPGLELFYTKDVFVVESDGRPRWCPDCYAFKPDRSHHSSEMNRCVYKMDHYCPWVGGMIGENCGFYT